MSWPFFNEQVSFLDCLNYVTICDFGGKTRFAFVVLLINASFLCLDTAHAIELQQLQWQENGFEAPDHFALWLGKLSMNSAHALSDLAFNFFLHFWLSILQFVNLIKSIHSQHWDKWLLFNLRYLQIYTFFLFGAAVCLFGTLISQV